MAMMSYTQWLGNRPNNSYNYNKYQSEYVSQQRKISPVSSKLHLGGMGVASPTSQRYYTTQNGNSIGNYGTGTSNNYTDSNGGYTGDPNDLDAMLSYWTNYYSNYDTSAYDQARQAAMEAQQAAIDQAVGRLEKQRPDIIKTAKKAAQENYANSERTRINMPQIMSAMGQTGGASETSALQARTNYDNNEMDIISNRDSALRNLDSQIADVEASGDIALANIDNQYAMAIAQLQQQQKDEQNAMMQQLMMNYQSKANSGSRSGGGSGSKLSYTQAKAAYDDGVRTPEVISVLNDYLGEFGELPTKANSTAATNNDTRYWAGTNSTYSPSVMNQALADYRASGLSLTDWLANPQVAQGLRIANLYNWFKNYAPR